MLKEASKYLLVPALLLLGACSGSDADRDAADSLVAEASAALDRGDFGGAEALLDSLTATYPKQIAAGRAALALRPKVIVRKTEQEIVDLQALLQYTDAYVDSLAAGFKTVPASDDVFEPYIISKEIPDNWRERNTAVARLTPAGEFYVISSVATTTAHHTALRLTGEGGVSVTSGTVPFDATDRLSRESVRFAAGRADTLGVFAMQMDGRGSLTLEFVGGKPAPKATLSPKEVHAMADTWRLGSAMQTVRGGAARLEQLKAKLQLARDQVSRTDKNEE